MLAAVLLVARVQFDVPVAAAFVLEQPHAVVATERHFLTMSLSITNKKMSLSTLQILNSHLTRLF